MKVVKLAQYLKKEYLKLNYFSFEIRWASLWVWRNFSWFGGKFQIDQSERPRKTRKPIKFLTECWLLLHEDWQSVVIIEEKFFLNVPFVEDKWPQKTNFPSFTEVKPGIVIQI